MGLIYVHESMDLLRPGVVIQGGLFTQTTIRPFNYAAVAQLTERLPSKQEAAGLKPVRGSSALLRANFLSALQGRPARQVTLPEGARLLQSNMIRNGRWFYKAGYS